MFKTDSKQWPVTSVQLGDGLKQKNMDNLLHSNAVFQHTPTFYFLSKGYDRIYIIYLPHSGISLHVSMHFAILRAKGNECSH